MQLFLSLINFNYLFNIHSLLGSFNTLQKKEKTLKKWLIIMFMFKGAPSHFINMTKYLTRHVCFISMISLVL